MSKKHLTIKNKIVGMLALSIAATVALSIINHYHLKQSAVLFQNAAWAWKVLDATREVGIRQESFLRLVSEENIDDVSKTLEHLEKILYQNQSENKHLPKLIFHLSGYRKTFNETAGLALNIKSEVIELDRFSTLVCEGIREKVISYLEQKETWAIMAGEDVDINEKAMFNAGYVFLEPVRKIQYNIILMFLYRDMDMYAAEKEKAFSNLDTAKTTLELLLPSIKDEKLLSAGKNITSQVKMLGEMADSLETAWAQRREKRRNLDAENKKLIGTTQAFLADNDIHIKNVQNQISFMSLMISLCTVTVLIFSGWLIIRSVNRVLRSIIKDLRFGAEQIRIVSSQISESSRSLADRSSEQAASVEETFSSLEQISSMTRQNADNARQIDTLIKIFRQAVDRANMLMSDLTNSMTDISRAGQETSRIIKISNEIAFQTNMLALNAAVEAARAGESGAGFAVVSGEVRNLAVQAKKASENTSYLIEKILNQVSGGKSLVTETDEAFSEVSVSSANIDKLIGEIASALNEQTLCIDNISKAIAEVNQITQQNTAYTQVSVSFSETMNIQAELMNHLVSTLGDMLGE